MLKTPVLFVVFNRPKLAQRVLAAIRQAKPSRLFIAADGPRTGKPGDYEKCQAVRTILRDGIDWDCEVRTLLRDRNLGCKAAVSSAITWLFEQVEEGIILEDDTLPTPDFFPFCQELLNKYRDNPTVVHISGNNFQFGRKRGDASYYFSIYNHNWGWATWRRAWQFYDVTMTSYPVHRQDEAWLKRLSSSGEREYWLSCFDRTWRGQIDTWDFQWTFAVWLQGGLSILPNANLVSNIGHGSNATHTSATSNLANVATGRLSALIHPSEVTTDARADRFAFEHVFAAKRIPFRSLWERLHACRWAISHAQLASRSGRDA